MEQNRIVEKKGKNVIQKAGVVKQAKLTVDASSDNDLDLIMDNSLKKYANEPFIIEQAKKVNQKFAQNK